ncbi:hypothetical protein PAXINDRAFT_11227 [Paxillus involutus ATCC 200175]|nr:hypothetical protein PAXINDRAFT_11227 [Paxillus involutus ATCC 200175]
MVIDDKNKGVPVAQILFMARKEAKAVHTDYNGKVLEDLLMQWKAGMDKNKHGEAFEMCIANTDNDARERLALRANWKDVFLILCHFHTWQAWRNGLNRSLRVVPKDERQLVRHRLAKFLMKLLKDITIYETAVTLYNKELQYFKNAMDNTHDPLVKARAKGGLAFFAYFQDYLKSQAWWLSWSPGGVIEAARRMNIHPDRVAKTTNHLESFNGCLKQKFFGPYYHNGRLPRLDLWVMILITQVLPDFFNRRDNQCVLAEYHAVMRQGIFGPQHLNEDASMASDTSSIAEEVDPLDDWDEEEMLDEMSDEVFDPDAQDFADEDVETSVPFFGVELKISDDGKSADPVPVPSCAATPLSEDIVIEDFSMWALDAEDILYDIRQRTLPPSEPPTTSATSNISISSHHAGDLEAIALQDVLSAEDTLLVAVQKALSVSNNASIFERHISTSLHERLTGDFKPLPLMVNPPAKINQPALLSNSNNPDKGTKPLPHASSTRQSSPKKKLTQYKLESFMAQHKETRKPSHGFR